MQRASGAAVRAVIALGLTLGLASPLLAQRADRATISGVVTDNQSAAVPGATVTIKNEDTGVETVLVTNSAGAYTSPPLVLGRYSVTVDLAGFKKMVSSGILLQGGGAIRHDVALQVGDLTESVEVKSVAGISETRPDVSHTVDEKYYQDLPFITGSDVRLAESVLLMQPGYLPMRPNGDPMFRGSQFNSRINGGQAMATENFFDGAAFGYASGHQQSHESTPPLEAVQEVKVISTTYSAQYGHTSGGFIEYSSKSGTNAFRGSVYEYMADDALNQNTIFAERGGIEKTPIRNDNFGFTLGGPVRLPGYDGRNKTHFFVNLDYTRIRSGTIAGFGNTTPIDAFKTGDFGALLTGNQIGTDALGRPILQGQIFDPQTTRMVNDIPVRDPFPGNVIPAGHPLRSAVASRIVPLMVGPDREGLANNVAGVGVGDQTWELDARNIMFRVDQNFTPAFKTSTSFYWNRRPSVRNCEGVDGCNYEFDPEKESAQNTDYYGSGFFQRISTHHAHQQFDWIVSNNLLATRRSRGTAGSWGAITCRRVRTGRSGCGREPPIRPAVSSRRTPDRRRCDSTAAVSPTRRSGSRDGRTSASRRTIAGSSRATSRGRGDVTRSRGDSSSAITTSRPAAGQEGPRRATSTSTASAPPGTTQLETT